MRGKLKNEKKVRIINCFFFFFERGERQGGGGEKCQSRTFRIIHQFCHSFCLFISATLVRIAKQLKEENALRQRKKEEKKKRQEERKLLQRTENNAKVNTSEENENLKLKSPAGMTFFLS